MGTGVKPFEHTIRPYIVDVILPAIPSKVEELNITVISHLRSRLHSLKYCYRRKGFRKELIPLVDHMLDISLALWELMYDNAATLADVKDVANVRRLGLGANLIGQLEEVLSGEESPRDILINFIAVSLNWRSDSLWVKMTKAGHSLAVESHIMRLQDAVWQFLDEFALSLNDDLSAASALGDKVENALLVVADKNASVRLRVVFAAQIYVLLLHLYIRQILLDLSW